MPAFARYFATPTLVLGTIVIVLRVLLLQFCALNGSYRALGGHRSFAGAFFCVYFCNAISYGQ